MSSAETDVSSGKLCCCILAAVPLGGRYFVGFFSAAQLLLNILKHQHSTFTSAVT